MNIFNEILLSSNSSDFIFSNDTKVETHFDMTLLAQISILFMNFPVNSYVIWLIVRRTGNGLAAEIFILSLSICEIILCLDYLVFILLWFLSVYILHLDFSMLVFFLRELVTAGRTLFECLVCVERYLAVIHPVTFLKYKPLRYRLMCCAVAWVTIFGFGVFSTLIRFFDLFDFSFISWIKFILTFSIQLFCGLAVLKALKQSGPGERGREKEEENHMKRRAFDLILVTTVSMAITYLPLIIILTLQYNVDENFFTVIPISNACFALGGLVQPILFLYRVGKLNFIKCQ